VNWVVNSKYGHVMQKNATAIQQAAAPLPGSGRRKLVIRSVSKKQKPRRKGGTRAGGRRRTCSVLAHETRRFAAKMPGWTHC
jgi:hypothetical protein